MSRVLLVTFGLLPEGEAGGDLLVEALTGRGHEADWVSWDDPAVDWAGADLVAVRSTWDYHRRLEGFLAWARRVEGSTVLLNGADVFAWNADKRYLVDLAGRSDGVGFVPTALLDDATLVEGLTEALDSWGAVVLKPRVGAGGLGVVIATSTSDDRLAGLTAEPWVVQPVVESVRTSGESSVFVLDGRAVSQVDKVAADAEVRVNEMYGGRTTPVPLGADHAVLAEAAVRLAASIDGADLAYARVDMMRWADRWVISEIELIEPGLYLDVEPDNAERFADLVESRL